MSFFSSLLCKSFCYKSFKTNITKLQNVLPRCQTYNIQALLEIRRQNRCLNTRYLKNNFNVKNEILKHFRLEVKKGYTRRDVSFSPHERLKTVLYHPECNHLFNSRLEKLLVPQKTVQSGRKEKAKFRQSRVTTEWI